MEKLTADQRAVSYLIRNNLGDIMLTNKGEEKCYASDAMVGFASQEVAAEKQRWVEKIQEAIDKDSFNSAKEVLINPTLQKLLEGEKCQP
jgi:peptide deformylase